MRLLFWLLMAYVGYRLAKSWLGRPALRQTRPSPTPMDQGPAGGAIDDVMIRDPLCGVYFPRRDGVLLKRGNEQLYFCSPACRDQYVAQNRQEPLR